MSAGRVHLGVRVRDDINERGGTIVEVVDVAGNVLGDLSWSILAGGVRWKGGTPDAPTVLTLELVCERAAVDSLELTPSTRVIER